MTDYACVMLTFTGDNFPPTDYALLLSCPPGHSDGSWSLVAINLDTS
jgi:hypothetical protein